MSCEEASKKSRTLLVRWVCRCIELTWDGERDESALKDLAVYLEDTKGYAERLVKTVWKPLVTAREENLYSIDLCPLHACANTCTNVECCAKVLLQHGWPVSERCFSSGETALHLACKFDNWQMVKLLLTHGADPNATGWRCRTPMMAAVAAAAHRCLDVLMDQGASAAVNDYDYHGHLVVRNAVAYAAEIGNVTVIRKLLTRYSFNDMFDGSAEPLFSAVTFAQHGCLEALLDYAAEQGKPDLANATNAYGKTLLMKIGRGCYLPPVKDEARNVDCLKLLLQRGADANAKLETIGLPALYDAVHYGQSSEFCTILLNVTDLEGMDASARDAIVNETVFMGMTPVIKALCEKKAGLLREKGFSFIVRAVFSKHLTVEMIDLLVEAGVDIVKKFNKYNPRFLDNLQDNLCSRCDFQLSSSAVILDVFGLLLKAGAAENLNVLLDLLGALRGRDVSREPVFSGDIAELLWQFSTQNHWNAVAPTLLGLKPVPRLPTLRHSSRSAVRSALMTSGRFHSMRGVNIDELRLPRELERYVMFL